MAGRYNGNNGHGGGAGGGYGRGEGNGGRDDKRQANDADKGNEKGPRNLDDVTAHELWKKVGGRVAELPNIEEPLKQFLSAAENFGLKTQETTPGKHTVQMRVEELAKKYARDLGNEARGTDLAGEVLSEYSKQFQLAITLIDKLLPENPKDTPARNVECIKLILTAFSDDTNSDVFQARITTVKAGIAQGLQAEKDAAQRMGLAVDERYGDSLATKREAVDEVASLATTPFGTFSERFLRTSAASVAQDVEITATLRMQRFMEFASAIQPLFIEKGAEQAEARPTSYSDWLVQNTGTAELREAARKNGLHIRDLDIIYAIDDQSLADKLKYGSKQRGHAVINNRKGATRIPGKGSEGVNTRATIEQTTFTFYGISTSQHDEKTGYVPLFSGAISKLGEAVDLNNRFQQAINDPADETRWLVAIRVKDRERVLPVTQKELDEMKEALTVTIKSLEARYMGTGGHSREDLEKLKQAEKTKQLNEFLLNEFNATPESWLAMADIYANLDESYERASDVLKKHKRIIAGIYGLSDSELTARLGTLDRGATLAELAKFAARYGSQSAYEKDAKKTKGPATEDDLAAVRAMAAIKSAVYREQAIITDSETVELETLLNKLLPLTSIEKARIKEIFANLARTTEQVNAKAAAICNISDLYATKNSSELAVALRDFYANPGAKARETISTISGAARKVARGVGKEVVRKVGEVRAPELPKMPPMPKLPELPKIPPMPKLPELPRRPKPPKATPPESTSTIVEPKAPAKRTTPITRLFTQEPKPPKDNDDADRVNKQFGFLKE